MLGRSETVGNQLHGRVDKEADEHARRDDLHVRILLLVQVPGSARSQEIAPISSAIQDDHHKVDYLKRNAQTQTKLIRTRTTGHLKHF